MRLWFYHCKSDSNPRTACYHVHTTRILVKIFGLMLDISHVLPVLCLVAPSLVHVTVMTSHVPSWPCAPQDGQSHADLKVQPSRDPISLVKDGEYKKKTVVKGDVTDERMITSSMCKVVIRESVSGLVRHSRK